MRADWDAEIVRRTLNDRGKLKGKEGKPRRVRRANFKGKPLG